MSYLISGDPIVQRARDEEMLREERLEQERLAFREELQGILMFENDRDDGPLDCGLERDRGGW